jgi:hypothetical protein
MKEDTSTDSKPVSTSFEVTDPHPTGSESLPDIDRGYRFKYINKDV